MAQGHFVHIFIAVAVAFAAPLAVELVPRVPIPAAAVEILAGIVVGPTVLGWLEANDAPFQVLALLGLAMLLFLSGMEIDVAMMRGPALRLALRAFGLTIVLAAAAGFATSALGLGTSPLLLATIFTATTLGLVMPVLKDTGQLRTDFGRLVFVAASLAEFASIVFLTLLFSAQKSSRPETRMIFLVLFAIGVGVGARALGRAWHSRWLTGLLQRLEETSAQLRVRAAVVIMVGFVALADRLGVEAILGAFLAGVIFRVIDDDHRAGYDRFRAKLDGLGFGFLVPFFFVRTGATLDVRSLFAEPTTVLRIVVFLVAILAVRGLPAVLYRATYGDRRAVVAGLLQATTLSFVVVGAELGRQLGKLTTTDEAALIGAALLSVLIFPTVALFVSDVR